jgi:RHS repeat-associated protein
VKGKLAAWTIKRLKADNDNVSEETTTGFAGLAPEGAEDYTALAGYSGAMEEVAQGRQVDEAQVPDGTASVSVQGSAGTSVSLAAPSLGTTTTRGGGIIVPQCIKHALNTYYATDHLGTVRFTKTIDETGAVTTTTHDYEPFGVEITPTDECDNTHKFTGHERDTETQNDYMHFRFFSSNMGPFQKPDSDFDSPLSNPQGWNLYSYVKGNPVNFNDPTGHAAQSEENDKEQIKSNPTHTPEEHKQKEDTLQKYIIVHSKDKDAVRDFAIQLARITGKNVLVTPSGDGTYKLSNSGGSTGSSEKSSATAQKDLDVAMTAHTEVFMQGHTNGGNMRVDGGVSGGVGGNSMYLDPSDFKTQQYHGVSELAYSMGMTFFHEFSHTGAGGSLHDPGDKGLPTGVVTAVDHENQILSELGLPTRVGHNEPSTGRESAKGYLFDRVHRKECNRYFSNGGYVSTWYDVP